MQRRAFLQGTLSLMTISNLAFAHDFSVPANLTKNPILANLDNSLPYFDFSPKDIVPALEFLIEYNKKVIEDLVKIDNPTWENFYWPLEDADDKIARAWSPVAHLSRVADTKQLRAEYEKGEQLLTNFRTWMGMHKGLYQGFQKLKNAPAFVDYSHAQQKAIDNALRDFRRSGIELDEQKAKRFAEIEARLSELSTQYSKNQLDAEKAFEIIITDKERLAGIADTAIAAAAQSAKEKGKKGWRFTLDYASYVAVMTRAKDRELRKQMYTADITAASEQGPMAGKWDNTPIMQEMLALRDEKAHLLGFASFAEYALETRMANTPTQVMDFLGDLVQKARPQAKQDVQELREFAKTLGIDDMQVWDIAYVSTALKKAKYTVDNEKVREYFVAQKAIDGLFDMAKRVFGVVAKPRDVKSYHQDVQYYDLFAENGTHIAGFYIDMFARQGKRSGAWMDQAIMPRRLADGTKVLPVAYAVLNASKGAKGQPSLLYHNEVTTLFHEFGHTLHHLLTTIDVAAVSGVNVAWDVVEFPSQMLEGWTWEKESLQMASAHYQTGEPLPSEMLDKLIAAKNFQSARGLIRQLELGTFDFKLHNEYKDQSTLPTLREWVKRNIGVTDEPEWTRQANTFGHIFAGGYAAGYYSYLWAEVLAVDGFNAFKQAGLYNRDFGKKYVETFLSKGGSEDPMKLYKDFMGRAPSVDALLADRGIH